MKKIYRMRNLDCANCAAKMERHISKLEGVVSVSVNFLLQKMSLDLQDEYVESVTQKIAAIVRKIEPNCEIIGL